MKCKECSKVIPDGFTDCPWCGAVQVAPVVGQPVRTVSAESEVYIGRDLLIAISLLSSMTVFLVLNYFGMVREAGSLTLQNSSYFLGRCAGSFVLGAIIVFIFYKVSGKQPRSSEKLLAIFTVASVLSLVALAAPPRNGMRQPSPAVLRQLGDDLKNPKVSNKWDAPGRELLMDMLSLGRQYISEVSKLDETAKPLYTLESFRDAATVQQMVDQLHARIAVADKYGDLEPVFAKMKGYVAAVDASETEKREFLEGFESTLPNTRAAYKGVKDKERAWLQASLDLYQFALSKSGQYGLQNGSLLFKKNGDADVFNRKLTDAKTRQTEFLRAYWEIRRTQQAMVEQMGLQGTKYDPTRSR